MVLMVVDTQNLIMSEGLYKFQPLVENIKFLIKAARDNSKEVIFVRHNDANLFRKGTPGFDIYDEFAPAENEKIFDKWFNSAFKDTGLLEYLKEKNEKELMIVGLQTEFCIDATIKCGFEHGFKMIVPEFCNSTFSNKYMEAEKSYEYYNTLIWKDRYADCVSFEKAIRLLK